MDLFYKNRLANSFSLSFIYSQQAYQMTWEIRDQAPSELFFSHIYKKNFDWKHLCQVLERWNMILTTNRGSNTKKEKKRDLEESIGKMLAVLTVLTVSCFILSFVSRVVYILKQYSSRVFYGLRFLFQF